MAAMALFLALVAGLTFWPRQTVRLATTAALIFTLPGIVAWMAFGAFGPILEDGAGWVTFAAVWVVLGVANTTLLEANRWSRRVEANVAPVAVAFVIAALELSAIAGWGEPAAQVVVWVTVVTSFVLPALALALWRRPFSSGPSALGDTQ